MPWKPVKRIHRPVYAWRWEPDREGCLAELGVIRMDDPRISEPDYGGVRPEGLLWLDENATSSGHICVRPGDWIVRHGSGLLEIVWDGDFRRQFEVIE